MHIFLPDQIDETAIPTIDDLMEFFEGNETNEFGGAALKRNQPEDWEDLCQA